MKSLELKPQDLPMTVKLRTQDGTKVYLLLGTKQKKLPGQTGGGGKGIAKKQNR